MKYETYFKEHQPSWLVTFVRERLYKNIFLGLKLPSILEIGIGACELPIWLEKRHFKTIYIAVEPDANMRSLAVRKGFYTIDASAPELAIENRNFAVIYAAHMIEHLHSYEQISQFMERTREILDDDGLLILLYPDVEKSKFLFYQDYTHVYPTTKKRVEDMLRDAGFEITRSEHYCGCFTNKVLVWILGKVYFLLPRELKLRAQICGLTIGRKMP